MARVDIEEINRNKQELQNLRMNYVQVKMSDYIQNKFNGRLTIEFNDGNIVRLYNNEMLIGATDIGLQLDRMV